MYQAIEQKNREFTQKDLAVKFGFSLSTVFNALKAPRATGAIKVTGRNFRIIDIEKLLYLWATVRNIKKDIIYRVRVDLPPMEIEGQMPPAIIYGAYSAYRLKFNEAPADYDKVYVYADNLDGIKKRFPSVKTENQNLFVLRADEFLKNYGNISPLAQIFADLWNLPDWYAKDFQAAAKEKILQIYGQ